MKFNVEIEIDWIGDDWTAGEVFKSKVEKALVEKISTNLEDKIFNEMDLSSVKDKAKKIQETIDQKIMETYDNFLEKEFTVYNEWGEPQKKTSVKEILKDKLNNFMTDKVDGCGNVKEYGGELRYKRILNEQSQKQIDQFINGVSKEVINGIRKDINTETKNRVVEAILGDYDLKKLIKGSD